MLDLGSILSCFFIVGIELGLFFREILKEGLAWSNLIFALYTANKIMLSVIFII